ncbi:MAG TPA: TonB-dependent receptor, partial [Bacteroidales bacterium]|nr:TonB-dependent receptor [Bacteroidales bacterium]
EGRADFIWNKFYNHRIEFGMNSILYNLTRGDILPYGVESTRSPISLGKERGIESAVYISDEFSLLPRLNLLIGLRYSYYSQLGPAEIDEYRDDMAKSVSTIENTNSFGANETIKSYSGLEPRASMNFTIDNSTSIKASYCRMQQYIFLLSNTIAIAPTDQWKLTDYHIKPPISDQFSLGLYHDFDGAGINTSVELYRKFIDNVVEYKDGANFISPDPIETQILQGKQDSKGVEIMIRKKTNNLTGWLSYTYSRSMVTVDNPLPDNRINNGNPFPSNYDRPHSLNLVSNYQVSRRISLSTNIVYMTGRPVTLPVSTYFSEGKRYLLYSSRNKYRIPDYFRIDFSINFEGNLKYKKLAHSYWMLNIYNLTGRKNAYSVFYESQANDINGYKLSIFARPIMTLSWNFKFGNYNSE